MAFRTGGGKINKSHEEGMERKPLPYFFALVVTRVIPDQEHGERLALHLLQQSRAMRFHPFQKLKGGFRVQPDAEHGENLPARDGKGAEYGNFMVLVSASIHSYYGRVANLAPSVRAVRFVLDIAFVSYHDIEKAPFFSRFLKRTLNDWGSVSSFRWSMCSAFW